MMKFLVVLLLASCASRYGQFDAVEPGMTKADLRDEMVLVEDIITLNPYEFRSYEQGLVLIKDDTVLEKFAYTDKNSYTVTCSSKGKPQVDGPRFFIRPAVSGLAPHQDYFLLAKKQLAIILKLKGFVVVELEEKSNATIIMEFDVRKTDDPAEYSRRFSMSAVSGEKGSLWRVNAKSLGESNHWPDVAPALMTAALEFVNLTTREDKKVDVRFTNASMQIMRRVDEIDKLITPAKLNKD